MWSGYYHGVKDTGSQTVLMYYYMLVHIYGTNMTHVNGTGRIDNQKDCKSPDSKNKVGTVESTLRMKSLSKSFVLHDVN